MSEYRVADESKRDTTTTTTASPDGTDGAPSGFGFRKKRAIVNNSVILKNVTVVGLNSSSTPAAISEVQTTFLHKGGADDCDGLIRTNEARKLHDSTFCTMPRALKDPKIKSINGEKCFVSSSILYLTLLFDQIY